MAELVITVTDRARDGPGRERLIGPPNANLLPSSPKLVYVQILSASRQEGYDVTSPHLMPTSFSSLPSLQDDNTNMI